MCTTNTQQAQDTKQETVHQTMHINQQEQQNLMRDVHAEPIAQNAAQTETVDAHALYLQQTAGMQDTASLGKRSFKGKSAEHQEIKKREKALGKKFKYPTAYTATTSKTLTTRLANHEELKKKKQKVKTMSMLNTLLFFKFTPQMFLSSEIREHLNKYMELVQNYEYLKENYPDLHFQPEALPAFKSMEPVILQLKRRLTLYCEKNGVTLDGQPVQKQNNEQLTNEDIESWYQTVYHYNHPDEAAAVTAQPTDAQRLAQRERNMETAPANAVQIPKNQQLRELSQDLRTQCMQTHSDRLAQDSMLTLQGLSRSLSTLHLDSAYKAVNSYLRNTRYTAGYTKERACFKQVVSACKSALKKTNLTDEQRALLNQVLREMDTLSDGTLQVPETEKIKDYSGKKPQESGDAGRGHKRNAAIRAFTHWSDQKDEPLFAHPPVVNDLKQRLVSNCYMMAATAGLVNCNPDLLRDCIKDNHDGTVTVRLYERVVVESQSPEEMPDLDDPAADDFEVIALEKTELRPIYVKVTKEVPRIGGTDALSAGALWMQMIEKACAFVGKTAGEDNKITGYQSLWYGRGGDFLERLLGVSPEYDSVQTPEEQDDLFERICHCVDQHTVFHAGSKKGNDGLNDGHAYTVMGGVVKDGQRFVLLRNPYSTHSLKYNEDGSREMSGALLSTSSDATYGQFYMPYEDFLKDFKDFSHTSLDNYQK